MTSRKGEPGLPPELEKIMDADSPLPQDDNEGVEGNGVSSVSGRAGGDPTPSRPPCRNCGAPMDGEHHMAKRCETCRKGALGKATRANKEEKPKKVGILPELEVVPGELVQVDDFCIEIYKYLKHQRGYAKNGIIMCLDALESGVNVPSDIVDLAVELDEKMGLMPFGDVVANRKLIVGAVREVQGKDIAGKFKVY